MSDQPQGTNGVEADPPHGEEIYEPSEEDRDPDAEAQMHMGKGDDNALYDPWFGDAEQAQTWEPGSDFDSEAEG